MLPPGYLNCTQMFLNALSIQRLPLNVCVCPSPGDQRKQYCDNGSTG